MVLRAIRCVADLYGIRKKQARLYLLRCVTHPRQTRNWLDYINQNSLLLKHNNVRLDLASKIHRPFLRPSFKIDDRRPILPDHLNIMATIFCPLLIRKIFNEENIEIAQIRGKTTSYRITMFRDKKLGKEGELSIALQSGETGAYLATA